MTEDQTTPEGQAADPVAEYEKKIPPAPSMDEAHEAAKEEKTDRPRVIFSLANYVDDVGHNVMVQTPLVNPQHARPDHNPYTGMGGMTVRTPHGPMPHRYRFEITVEEGDTLRVPKTLAEAFDNFEESARRGADKEIADLEAQAKAAALNAPIDPELMRKIQGGGGQIIGP